MWLSCFEQPVPTGFLALLPTIRNESSWHTCLKRVLSSTIAFIYFFVLFKRRKSPQPRINVVCSKRKAWGSKLKHWFAGGIGMSTMQKEAILKKCLNIFVPHWNNLRSTEIGGQDFNTYHWNSNVHPWFSTKQRVHQVIVHLRNQWSYGSYKMRKLKVKDRRRQQNCHKKKRKNVAKFSWAWIIKTVTKLRER